MADSEFSALRVRRRLEDIAGTIAQARISGDVYASLDAVEAALLGVMEEVADIAHAVAAQRARAAEPIRRPLRAWLWPLSARSQGRTPD